MMGLEDRMLLAASVGFSNAVGFTPAQVQTAYGINSISLSGVSGNGAGQTIAVVDVGNDPTIASDLQAFDSHFLLPAPPSFTVVNQNGVPVNPIAPPPGLLPTNGTAINGSSIETALDVEWAHAIAPGASILLVEANSFDIGEIAPVVKTPATSDYATAVRTAAGWPGVSVVSMSFGTPEFPTEQNWDSVFTTPAGHPNVTFLASSGDSKTRPGPPPTPPQAALLVTSTAPTRRSPPTSWPSAARPCP